MPEKYYVISFKGRAGEITGTTNKLELQYIMYKSNADEKTYEHPCPTWNISAWQMSASNTMATWTKALHVTHGGREARILRVIHYTGDTLAT